MDDTKAKWNFCGVCLFLQARMSIPVDTCNSLNEMIPMPQIVETDKVCTSCHCKWRRCRIWLGMDVFHYTSPLTWLTGVDALDLVVMGQPPVGSKPQSAMSVVCRVFSTGGSRANVNANLFFNLSKGSPQRSQHPHMPLWVSYCRWHVKPSAPFHQLFKLYHIVSAAFVLGL